MLRIQGRGKIGGTGRKKRTSREIFIVIVRAAAVQLSNKTPTTTTTAAATRTVHSSAQGERDRRGSTLLLHTSRIRLNVKIVYRRRSFE